MRTASKAAVTLLAIVGTLAAIEFSPPPTIPEGIHYLLLGDDGQVVRKVESSDLLHGDQLLVVYVCDSKIREAYTYSILSQVPGVVSMMESKPVDVTTACTAVRHITDYR